MTSLILEARVTSYEVFSIYLRRRHFPRTLGRVESNPGFIIQPSPISRYEEALAGRCLGDRFKMIVPPHLAYGESGVMIQN